ncbi:PREDICTED: BTB/POZ domain-containing protein 7-like, partial [Papilio xuthus]|uniref:BTB/POZ domain-containing protein 7-like n=1 Tax=Papilio xuthus TaxID=66420 RepID=A0AAJ6ZT96_PAPXU
AWSGVSRTSPRPNNTTTLDDAFQLYEIARFLEMPIVVQGCEDAIVEALSADTLPHVLRWAAAPHASQWVHRQAMRYLRDEFPAIMWQASSARLPRSAVAEALGSPFLQASEAQALRALLRWAERAAAPKHAQHDNREPNVIWHTAHSVSRRGARRRESGEQAVRDLLAALLPLVRLEHLPPDCDLLHQAVRRGAVAQPPAQMVEGGGGAEAWLGRGASRPPRCFIPYLDEIKALLEDQAVPEAEVSRVRRARFLHRIPDTLYMVAAARSGASSASGGVGGVGGAGGGVGGAEAACVSPRVLAALRARVRELRAAPPAQRALLLHATDTKQVHHQIALRAVREMSLPDTCADLLTDLDDNSDNSDKECGGSSLCVEEEWACGSEAGAWPSGSGSLRSGNSRAAAVFLQAERESSTCRRELPPRPDTHRSVRGRLSACVPDVAMAPNANTHLLTARDY